MVPSTPSREQDEQRNKLEGGARSQDGEDSIAELANENLRGWKLALVMVGLCLGVFCMALDNTIIATAIPRITDEFGALDDLGW
ncbi:hypothetical protein NM208_g4475 [Fusarium decemcellulare]|uniref:Uncharacterized protein n=1 Tax=Fusarium decemcellulare TaxID=57161 RepID=A0ACC1SKM6_9HYPO|nr:hypothetical protein NM208_g4475 [Fusarium decemcellulare]